MRVRAAQHRPVQHAGQLHVVHVRALAADEPLILLAQHPAEARDAMAHPAASGSSGRECFAAQRIDLTMFS